MIQKTAPLFPKSIQKTLLDFSSPNEANLGFKAARIVVISQEPQPPDEQGIATLQQDLNVQMLYHEQHF